MADTENESAKDEKGTTDTDADGMSTDAGKRALQKEREEKKALKAELDKLKPLAEAARKAEEDKLGEVERLTRQITELTAERDRSAAESIRYRVALDKGLTLTRAKRLVGSTEEELAADADELLKDLGVTSEGDDSKEGKRTERRPVDTLKPGSGTEQAEPEETDTRKLGARIFDKAV